MAAPPHAGYVRITSKDPPLAVTARLGADRPSVDSGYGGWAEVERPRRSPLTTYKAPPGLHLTLPLLLDGWSSGRSVERDLARIERMAKPGSANADPPKVKIATTGSAVPYQGRTWVIASIDWGDALMNANGNRVRQAFTLYLFEYVEDVHLTEKSAARRRRASAAAKKTKSGAAAKRITAKRSSKAKPKRTRASDDDDFGAGEDLLAIAARELGDADRWREIAELNGLRDPRAIAPGQTLRMP